MGFAVTYNDVSAEGSPFRDLSVRARKTLARLGVGTVDDLCAKTFADLREARNCGLTTATELQDFLVSIGRSFPDCRVTKRSGDKKPPQDAQLLLDGFKPRDWLAGQAMAAIVLAIWQMGTSESEEEIAAAAYKQADAMIAERKKHPECRQKWDDKNPRSTT